ncbi:MAG TPA: hypothetical protein EYP61_06990, partial [Candidatus Latescibacteria bacterium]|nr:hypothetical protein [Candidatus Latescibacterota bacterium]
LRTIALAYREVPDKDSFSAKEVEQELSRVDTPEDVQRFPKGVRGMREFQVISKSITSRSRAGYYPGGYPLTVKLIVERTSGRLLGAQLVGREGAALRVNIFAAALYTRMTVEDLAQLDLGYAPPFSPVWDPVLVAANETFKLLR